MTLINDFDIKCAVCTKTSPQPVMLSTSVFGYPDLDLRPSEMQRSSMFAWLQECPHCGYVAGNLGDELKVPSDILQSEEYLTCEGYEFKSNLAKKFFKHYLISKAEKNHVSQFYSLLHCAWACDDAEDDLSVDVRKLALKSIDKIDAASDDEKDNLKLIKADLLRRSLQFDKLICEFKDVVFEDELKNEVITFQRDLALRKDSACYTIDDIPKQVTITLEGKLLKKLKLVSDITNLPLVEIVESLLKQKADETDPDELIDKLLE